VACTWDWNLVTGELVWAEQCAALCGVHPFCGDVLPVLWPDGTVRHLLAAGRHWSTNTARSYGWSGLSWMSLSPRAAADARTRLAAVALRLAEAGSVEEINTVLIEDGLLARPAWAGRACCGSVGTGMSMLSAAAM
jgi:hypothetical protein